MRKSVLLVSFLLVAICISAQNDSGSFSFVLITDTHVGGNTGEEDLRRSVDDINSMANIDFAIHSGDVTEFGSDEELKLAKSILDRLNVPLYILPGNHDSNWSESGTNSFLKIFGAETFGFEHKGYKFMGLASGPNMRMGPGQIPRENLTWFFDELKRTDTEIPIIYVNHYPMDNSLNNWFEVMDALHPYNVQLMLCGHGHANKKSDFEGIQAAMCRSNLRAKEKTGGYSIITVNPGSIEIRERIVPETTNEPWITFTTTKRPDWDLNAPRPNFNMNNENNFVSEVWSIQENSDIGSGMAISGKRLIYNNTAGEIKAVGTKSGKPLWKYKTDGKIYSTPSVYKNRVWCASSDSHLYGLDLKSGKLKHKLKTGKAIVSAPACDDNKVMVAGSDGYCRAWNVKSGKLVWQFDSVKNFVVTQPQVKEGTLFFGSWGNEFYAIGIHTGKPRWIWHNGQTNRMFSPAQTIPVFAHSRIYLASPDRYMTVLDQNKGSVIWRYNDPENRVRESVGISEDGNTVYAKMMDGKILAIDATTEVRKIKWTSSGEDMGYELAPTPVVEKNGIIYAATDKGLIYAFRASDGRFLWKYRISYGLINWILPTDNNELYVSAMDGKLVKLQVSNR